MKKLRPIAHYFWSLSVLKSFFIICVIFGIFILYMNFSRQECFISENQPYVKINQLSEKTIEKLKQKWLAEYENSNKVIGDKPPDNNPKVLSISSVECLINDDSTIQCLQNHDEDDTVYMPFSFIGKYFDVSGQLKHYDGYNRFEFTHSYAKNPYVPKGPYLYHGPFLTFDSYNVEYRSAVKFVSGSEGVPITTQWNKTGYFYPIQISQYALSHYSKSIVNKRDEINVIEDGENGIQSKWKMTNRLCSVNTVFNKEVRSNILQFSTPESLSFGSGAVLSLSHMKDNTISFDIKFISNGSMSVTLEISSKKKEITIHYVTTSMQVRTDKNSNIFYGIGKCTQWKHVTRDLTNDLIKGLGSKDFKLYKVSRIILRGKGFIDNITISKSAYLAHFRDGCNWLMKNQDIKTGGWRTFVVRPSKKNTNSLSPGWLSAMAQGQALSALSRSYHMYGNDQYIRTMSLALNPYTVSSDKGGVRAVFMDKYPWYEEYPTDPSSFVLNGFIFSMIGLYDFKSLLEDKFRLNTSLPLLSNVQDSLPDIDLPKTYKLVSHLFDEGLISLKALLPLYDGGTRTFYDLLHFQFKIPPNIARWDYHQVHCNLLKWLSLVTEDPLFSQYYKNWFGYTKGKVAPHN